MSLEFINNIIKSMNEGKCTFDDIDKGTYDVYIDICDEAYLFSVENEIKTLKYLLNDRCSNVIMRIIRKNKLKIVERVTIEHEKYKDYKLKLICENEYNEIYVQIPNNTKIYIQFVDNEYKLIFDYGYNYSDIKKIQPNTKYIVTNLRKTKYGGIMTSNSIRYSISDKATKSLLKYCRVVNDKLQCTYNGISFTPKIIFETGEAYSFKGKDKNGKSTNFNSCYQSFKIIKDNQSLRFFVNKGYDIDYHEEGIYRFMLVYVDNNPYVYDHDKDKYYKLSIADETWILDKIDQEIKICLNNGENPNAYSYINYKDNKLILVLEYKKDDKGLICKKLTVELLKEIPDDMLDISKLETYDIIDESDIPTTSAISNDDLDKLIATANENNEDKYE